MNVAEKLGVMRFVSHTDKMQAKLVKLQQLEALWMKWKEAMKLRNEFQNKWDAEEVPDPLEVARECSAMIRAKEALEAWQP